MPVLLATNGLHELAYTGTDYGSFKSAKDSVTLLAQIYKLVQAAEIKSSMSVN